MAKQLNYTNKRIRDSIVFSFLKRKPQYFIPFLMSDNTIVEDDSKIYFYKLFKYRILTSKVKGKIKDIRVEKEFNGFYDDYFKLNFYDEYHLNPRFSIFYKFENEKIHLGLMPF